MSRRESAPPEGRDQDPTTFAEILQHLIWLEPRARAAVLIDGEGETVDYATSLPSYYTKVAAANLRVVLDDVLGAWRKMPLSESGPSDIITHAIVRAQQRTFFVRPLPDGYALSLVLRRGAFTVSQRAVALTVCRLAKEAGWPAAAEESLPWHPAEVDAPRAARFRPAQVKAGDAWEQVEVLGSVAGGVGLARERGYRCRLQGGAEITLVRESTGVWYMDQPTRGLSSRLGPESVAPGRNSSPADSGAAGATQRDSRVGTAGERGDMWVKEAKRAR